MTRFLPRATTRLFVACLTFSATLPAHAQQRSTDADRALLATETYVKPPEEIARLVAAPRQLNSTLTQQSPDRRHFLVVHAEGLGSEERFGRPHYYFGGLQVDGRANRVRSFTTRGIVSLEIADAMTGARTTVKVPQGATASSPTWSPDGSKLAYFANFDDASYVYVADASSGASRRVSDRAAMPVLATTLDWAADGSAVYAVVVPSPRAAKPTEPVIATGPVVRLTQGKLKTRTYPSLLDSPFDKALLEYYATGQLARLELRGGVKAVGSPAMIQSVDVSPDGKYLRVSLLQKPFSYAVPVSAFGSADELWSADGKRVATLATHAMSGGEVDDGPRTGADSGRRAFAWTPNGGLSYLLQDATPRRRGGAASRDSSMRDSAAPRRDSSAARKDRLYVWAAPFDSGSATAIAESDNRIAGFVYSTDGKWVLLSENTNGVTHTYAQSLAQPGTKHTIFRARGAQAGFGGGFGGGGGGGAAARGGNDDDGFYTNPGRVVLRQRGGDRLALVSPDGGVFLEGTQYSRNPRVTAPRTFVDRVDLATGANTRLFVSDTSLYESAPMPVDDDFSHFVTTRETETTVPDQWLREKGSDKLVRLTSNKDVTAEITNLPRKIIPVTRADGKTFWVNVTLPANYKEGSKLPAMFWFYPYEYTDQESYDRTRRTVNKHKYPVVGPRSMEIMATQGYAIVQPDMPIFGAAGRMNDNYITDLRNGLTAVIDELDAQGIIDRQRLGIGGHSYGAFSTVNAMVNLPFFKAGIAGDGNYNRALTPNGFQSERRDLWEARETYLAMSPFLYADRLQGALLMYHSLEDQNVGTDPTNSIRLFHALQGMGKTASLFMYPYEDHGPLTQETLFDQWARWTAWLDLYVKNSGGKAAPAKLAAMEAAP